MTQAAIFTVGHSILAWTEFVQLLQRNAIELLVDVRSYPQSRRHPQFSRAQMEPRLASAGIAYQWAGRALGGFRKPLPESRHLALGNDAFRGYADHMSTPEFGAAIESLVAWSGTARVVVMCAEADYRHCHRQFIADYLTKSDMPVFHIRSLESCIAHRLSDAARVSERALIYDVAAQQTFDFD